MMVLIMSRGKRTYLSAIDAGFRWSAAHRTLRDVVERERHWSGGMFSYGYAVNMFANAAKYRDFWERRWAGDSSVHLTPQGTYFLFQGNSGQVDWTGAYVRSDGTTGRFQGRHNYPLYCVGCGRADLRITVSLNCTKPFPIPAELLMAIPRSPSAPAGTIGEREEREWRKKSRALELEQVAKIKKAAEPPPAPVPVPRPVPARQGSVRKPGPVEEVLLSTAGSFWGTFKFLLLIVLIALAASRR